MKVEWRLRHFMTNMTFWLARQVFEQVNISTRWALNVITVIMHSHLCILAMDIYYKAINSSVTTSVKLKNSSPPNLNSSLHSSPPLLFSQNFHPPILFNYGESSAPIKKGREYELCIVDCKQVFGCRLFS